MGKDEKLKNGFTLIEVIVVLAILSILATIAVPRYNGYIQTAEKNADNATCKIIYDTILILKSENITVDNSTIGNLIQGGWPSPQASDGVAFTYTLSPVVVKTSTPGVQHPKN